MSRSRPSGRLAALSRHALARSLYRSGSQLSGIKTSTQLTSRRCSFQQTGIRSNRNVRRTGHDPLRLSAMDARELRQNAMHYRRVARSVSDEAMAEALIEVAAEYDSLADRLERNRTDPGGSHSRGRKQCPLDQ